MAACINTIIEAAFVELESHVSIVTIDVISKFTSVLIESYLISYVRKWGKIKCKALVVKD